MEFSSAKHIRDLLKDKNIILKGADAATRGGFTQVPNFILKSKILNAGDKVAYSMLLSYAWSRDYCFPGQQTLASDMGLTERSVRTHLKALELAGFLSIKQRGQGKTNLYVVFLKARKH